MVQCRNVVEQWRKTSTRPSDLDTFPLQKLLTSGKPTHGHLFYISAFSFIWSWLKISLDSWTEAELVRGTETGIWQAVMDRDPRERQRVRRGRRGRRVEGWRSWEADGDSALALSPWGDKQPIWTTERKWWKWNRGKANIKKCQVICFLVTSTVTVILYIYMLAGPE